MADDGGQGAGVAATPTPDQDDLEWSQANDDFAKDKDFKPAEPAKKPDEEKKSEEGKKPDEPAKPEKKSEEKPPEKPDPKDKKPDEKPGPSDDPGKKAEENKPADEAKPGEKEEAADDDFDLGSYRQQQRQLAQDEAAIKEDVRKELFSDRPSELLDADGDPIRTIEDVQKLLNPSTGKPFTEDEAGRWLIKAQAKINEDRAEDDKKIDAIAQAILDVRDWTAAVKAKYGDFLKANPEIRQDIWVEYEKTLSKDEKSGIITAAPVNMENFFRVALEPHIKMAEQLQKQSEEDKKAKEEKDRKQARADRSDVYGGGKSGVTDPEDEEWNQAAKEYYGTK